MTYIEAQFQGLLETVNLLEDIAAVAAAPVNGGVISQVSMTSDHNTIFDNIFSQYRSKLESDLAKKPK